ncbi:hypothetical protein ABH908_000089 [Pseudomonas frederiksbergensis]|uniref:hypothetical protein n=1 Tax=Pseudomonas TaxID=286 RepID=UPI003D229BEE
MKNLFVLSSVLLALAGCAQSGSNPTIVSAPGAGQANIPMTANRYWIGEASQVEGPNKGCRTAGYLTPSQPDRLTFPSLSCPDSMTFVRVLAEPAQKLDTAPGKTHSAKCIDPNDMAVHAIEPGTPEFHANGKDAVMSTGGVLKPAEVPVPLNMVGTWKGTAQTAKGASSEISVDLSRTGRSTTRYAALKCEADLYMTGGASANVGLTEVAGQESAGCDAKTLVTFSTQDGKTLLRTAYSPETGKIISEAKLQKVGN